MSECRKAAMNDNSSGAPMESNNTDLSNVLDNICKNHQRESLQSENHNSRNFKATISQLVGPANLCAQDTQNDEEQLIIGIEGLSNSKNDSVGIIYKESRFSFGGHHSSATKNGVITGVNKPEIIDESIPPPQDRQSTVNNEQRKKYVFSGPFSPMMRPLNRTGYKTGFNQRHSKESTQKLPNIHNGRNSMSMGNTDPELLSQNLQHVDKKMKVEVTSTKNLKRLFIVVQPKSSKKQKQPFESPFTAHGQMSESEPPRNISCIDIRSAVPNDQFSPQQFTESSNIEHSENSSPNIYLSHQSRMGSVIKTRKIVDEPILEQARDHMRCTSDPGADRINFSLTQEERNDQSNLLAQVLKLKKVKQSPRQEKFQKGKQYKKDQSSRFLLQPPNVVPPFPTRHFVRQPKKEQQERPQKEQVSSRGRAQASSKTLVHLSMEKNNDLSDEHSSSQFENESPTEELRLWMNAMTEEREVKKQRVIELEHNPFESSIKFLKETQRAKHKLASKLTSPPNTNKKLFQSKKYIKNSKSSSKMQEASMALDSQSGIQFKQFLERHPNDNLNLVKILEQVRDPVSASQEGGFTQNGQLGKKAVISELINPVQTLLNNHAHAMSADEQPSMSHQITVQMGNALQQLVNNQKQNLHNDQIKKKYTKLLTLSEQLQQLPISASEMNYRDPAVNNRLTSGLSQPCIEAPQILQSMIFPSSSCKNDFIDHSLKMFQLKDIEQKQPSRVSSELAETPQLRQLDRIETEKIIAEQEKQCEAENISASLLRQSCSSMENTDNLQKTKKQRFDLQELQILEDEQIEDNIISVRSFKSGKLDLIGIKNDTQMDPQWPTSRQAMKKTEVQRRYRQIHQVSFHGGMMESGEEHQSPDTRRKDRQFMQQSPTRKAQPLLDSGSLSSFFFTNDKQENSMTTMAAQQQKSFRQLVMAASQLQKRPNRMVDLLIKDQERIYEKENRARLALRSLSLRKYPTLNQQQKSNGVNERKFCSVARQRKPAVMSSQDLKSKVEFSLPRLKHEQKNQQNSFSLLQQSLMQTENEAAINLMHESMKKIRSGYVANSALDIQHSNTELLLNKSTTIHAQSQAQSSFKNDVKAVEDGYLQPIIQDIIIPIERAAEQKGQQESEIYEDSEQSIAGQQRQRERQSEWNRRKLKLTTARKMALRAQDQGYELSMLQFSRPRVQILSPQNERLDSMIARSVKNANLSWNQFSSQMSDRQQQPGNSTYQISSSRLPDSMVPSAMTTKAKPLHLPKKLIGASARNSPTNDIGCDTSLPSTPTSSID